MAVAGALTIFVDTAKYKSRIDQIDVKLTALKDIQSEYAQLIAALKDEFTGEDSEIFESMRQEAQNQIDLLAAEIEAAQAARTMLQKTVDEMEDNASSVQNILQDSIDTVKNVVETTTNTSKAAAEAAVIAALL